MIEVAVFPVGGMGTRFLPITKAGPKEMLPIVDKPIIQYAVEEALQAGIRQLIFITSSSKRAIEDYFDSHYELENRLLQQGKLKALHTIQTILPEEISIVYIRQKSPLGLGDAVLCAKEVIGKRDFAVLLPDDILAEQTSHCLTEMIRLHQLHQAGILAVQEIPLQDSRRYGMVKIDEKSWVNSIVEKPEPSCSPSNLAVIGRYILPAQIFEILEKTQQGVGGEIQLTDALQQLIDSKQPILAYCFKGKRYDCGHPLGLLEATIDHALKRPELSQGLRHYLKTLNLETENAQ